MPIPEHYKQFCNNPELEIFSCDYLVHQDCPETCMLSRRLAQGISHSARTGLTRHLEKKERAKQKGFDWSNLRGLLPSKVPNEIKGEYKK